MKFRQISGKRLINGRSVGIRVIVTAVLASVAVAVATASTLTPATGAWRSQDSSSSGTVLFSLTVGKEIAYSGTGPEQQAWGPSALVVDDESIVWLADGAAHRVLGFDMGGNLRHEVSLADRVVGIGDIAVTEGALLALDIADQKPKIVVIDKQTGKTTRVLYLPPTASLQNGLTGVNVDANGIVLAELEFGLGHISVGKLSDVSTFRADEDAPLTKTGERLTAAGAVEILPSMHADNPSRSEVRVGGVDVHVDFLNLAGTTQFVGATDNLTYLAFEEISQDASGRVLVDSTLRMFDRSGAELGIVRVPHSDGVSVPRVLADVTPSGDALVAVGHADRLDIVRLEFGASSDVSHVLPRLVGEEQLPHSSGSAVGVLAASLPCVSRSQMSTVDSSYRTSSRTLSSTNITGTCSGRTKPRYLGSAGTYTSVPYDWGGFDSVSSFNSQMSPGTGKAGNINSSTQPSCAYGVDCSGFVSRVWRQSSKYGTATLPNISNTVALSSRKEFDIFNKSGSHTVLYRSTSGNSYYISESTTSSSLDRVVYRAVATSYVNGYTLRRYANVSNHPSELQCAT